MPGYRETPRTVLHSTDTLKAIREALATAQTFLPSWFAGPQPRHARDIITRLIHDIDRQRPLGPDGKHGNRHTPTCGCEPQGEAVITWPDGTVHRHPIYDIHITRHVGAPDVIQLTGGPLIAEPQNDHAADETDHSPQLPMEPDHG